MFVSETYNVPESQDVVTLEADITPVTCAGSSNGAIDLTVSGGTTPYTYSWSNGETTEDIDGLTGGDYTVTVTDAYGCVVSETYNVPESQDVVTLEADITPVTCAGSSNGAIDLTVSGGTTPYTYSWSNGETTEDIDGLTGGDYTVTVTDAYGCIRSSNHLIL